MKFLLTALNAKYIHSNPGLYSMKRYVGERGKHVEIAEYTINNRLEEILADLYKRQPDVIGISCYIWNYDMVVRLVKDFHKIMPQVPIWLGGPEVSYEAEKTVRELPEITGIMIGEGEGSFSDVLDYYLDNGEKSLSDIPGLQLQTGFTGCREPLDLSDLPFLYDDLEGFENRIIYYESQRGCPYLCSYCLSSIEKKVRYRSLEKVLPELQFFLDRKVPQVKFVDRTFNSNHEHTMGIWNYIYKHDNGVTNFHFEVEGDILRADEIELLSRMRPGLVQLEIGVQTANPVTLKEIRRYTDPVKLRANVDRIHRERNVHQHLDLIAGLPYEDYESFGHSFDSVFSMKPDQLQLGFLKVLKGSYMHEKAPEYELCYSEEPPYEVLSTKWLSYGDVSRLKQVEEMVETYYNSGQFTCTMALLLKASDRPFTLFEKLADFYEKQGLNLRTPARIYRYNALLSFAETVDPGHAEIYKECLVYDLYLRENLKSRPDFAPDQPDDRQQRTAFYRREEEQRSLLPGYAHLDSKQMERETHLECFRYPVWELTEENSDRDAGIGGCIDDPAQEKRKLQNGGGGYVLFDYSTRDPLNYEARTVRIMGL